MYRPAGNCCLPQYRSRQAPVDPEAPSPKTAGATFRSAERSVMTKVLHCGDLMHGCEYVAKADTEEELMQTAAQHAREKHGMRYETNKPAGINLI